MFRIIQLISFIGLLILVSPVQAEERGKAYADRSARMSEGFRPNARNRADLNHRGDLARKERFKNRKAKLARRNAARVKFNTRPRRSGSGYNNVRYDRRVAAPKSILKNSTANRAIHSERRFTRNLGAQTRGSMTHRGQVARHARKSSQYKNTLARTGKVARITSRSSQYKSALARAGGVGRHSRALRSAGRMVGGGIALYGAEQALGVNIPDAYEATEWTYNTFKSPKHAGRRIEKLGHDSVRTVSRGVRTLTNPRKMSRNISRSVRKTTKGISKYGCQIGQLFGTLC